MWAGCNPYIQWSVSFDISNSRPSTDVKPFQSLQNMFGCAVSRWLIPISQARCASRNLQEHWSSMSHHKPPVSWRVSRSLYTPFRQLSVHQNGREPSSNHYRFPSRMGDPYLGGVFLMFFIEIVCFSIPKPPNQTAIPTFELITAQLSAPVSFFWSYQSVTEVVDCPDADGMRRVCWSVKWPLRWKLFAVCPFQPQHDKRHSPRKIKRRTWQFFRNPHLQEHCSLLEYRRFLRWWHIRNTPVWFFYEGIERYLPTPWEIHSQKGSKRQSCISNNSISASSVFGLYHSPWRVSWPSPGAGQLPLCWNKQNRMAAIWPFWWPIPWPGLLPISLSVSRMSRPWWGLWSLALESIVSSVAAADFHPSCHCMCGVGASSYVWQPFRSIPAAQFFFGSTVHSVGSLPSRRFCSSSRICAWRT